MASFNRVKNGFDPDEVQSYIEGLEKSIQEYKEKDGAISNAIVNAQIAADNIIKNAELAAKDIKGNAIIQMESIEKTLEIQRRMITDFKDEYNEVMMKYIKKVNEDDFKKLFNQIDEMNKYFETLRNKNSEEN